MKYQMLLIALASSCASSASWAQEAQVVSDGQRVSVSVPLSVPQAPKSTNLADIIRAKFPLSIEFRELGVGWREISFRGQSYFSKGESYWVSDAEQLVAYKYDETLAEERATSERELIGRLTNSGRSYEPGDRFALTLLPLREVAQYITGGQTNLRSFSASRFRVPFDPPTESRAFRQNLTVLYLGQIGQAAQAYAAKYLNITPPLDTAFAARQALLPFASSERIFFVPGTNVPFKTNPILGDKKREHLRRRRSTVMFYQANPAEDGLRAVLLFSGQVRRVDAKAWARLSEASEIGAS